MMFGNLTLILAFLLSSAQCFVINNNPAKKMSTPTPLFLMNPKETQRLIQQATECSEGECSLDEVSALIDTLQAQQRDLNGRLNKIKTMIGALEVVNGSDNRKVNEVRETVRALHRVFQLGDIASGNDYPSLTQPTGWSGEVGSGSQTAYDVLPPKKWKKKASP